MSNTDNIFVKVGERILDPHQYTVKKNDLISGGKVIVHDKIPEGSIVTIGIREDKVFPAIPLSSSIDLQPIEEHLRAVENETETGLKLQRQHIEDHEKRIKYLEDRGKNLESVEGATEKREDIQSLATKTDAIAQKVENVDTALQSIPEQLQAKREKIEALATKTDSIAQKVDELVVHTDGVCRKIDQIDFSKIPPKIDKVEKKFKEEIKNTATIVQVHSLSLTDQIKTLDEHERRLAETATKEDLSNLKDLYVTPDELNLILENTSAKTQEAIKRLEQEIKDLKDASSSEVESLKNKLDNLISLRETLKNFKADIAEQITHLGNKTDRIETGARNLTEIVSRLCQKVDHVDIIQMDRDVTALASKSLEVAKTLETLEKKPPVDLNPLDNRIKDLRNMIDALEARIANTEKHVSNGNLVFQATEENKYPGVYFKGQDGKDIAQMFTRDGNLFIGTNDNNLLTSDGVKIGGLTLKEHMKNELSGRTTIRCAKLHTNESMGNIINSTSIANWQYPAENYGGRLSHAVASAIGLDDADKGKRWKVIGKTGGYYADWHWLQEVIEV